MCFSKKFNGIFSNLFPCSVIISVVYAGEKGFAVAKTEFVFWFLQVPSLVY